MKHLYIIDDIAQASCYGVKTYITQIIASWKSSPQGKLTVVKMNGSDNDIIETWSEGIRFLWIPKEDEENEIHYEEYCKELASVFTTCMSEAEQNIIQINFFRHSMFLNNIKEMMPSCKFIIVIHYFDWGLDIGNDLSKMEKILNKNISECTLKEKGFLRLFTINGSFFHFADRIICLSEYCKYILLNLYHLNKEMIHLSYNKLPDNAVFPNNEIRNKKKQNMFFHDNEKIILFVGRLESNKGIIFLLKAFRKLLNDIKNIRLVIVGGGEYDDYICEASDIAAKVVFTGKITQNRLYDLYQITDIGVLPSIYEQCSYVMIEMMMYGIPLIATNTSGLSEMIHEKENGTKIYAQFGSQQFIEEIYEKLKAFITMSDMEISKMKKHSRELYLKKYSLSALNQINQELWAV